MSRGPLRFKLADLRRVFRAVKEEELCARVTVDPESGSITVHPLPASGQRWCNGQGKRSSKSVGRGFKQCSGRKAGFLNIVLGIPISTAGAGKDCARRNDNRAGGQAGRHEGRQESMGRGSAT